ncbi:hypothetical protein NA57DRAFT_15789, partial [Rhizodiscina lignyota]
IYETYQSLPFPRASYLTPFILRRLLYVLTFVPRHNDTSVLRYLSIMDDMKVAHIPATNKEWNTAISLAAQTFRRVTNAEVESALYIWRDMEKRAGIAANEVTFNILFNMASKANKFPLVELILKEMTARNLPKKRAFYCCMIFHAGQLRDGDAVRRAYKDLVEAGEIVDSVVLNNVIRSLFAAGEHAAADAIFERMKVMHQSPAGRRDPPNAYNPRRLLRSELQELAVQFRDDTQKRREVQDRAPLAPDTHTYALMIKYYARNVGDYHRVAQLLNEMDQTGVPLARDIFHSLFIGFWLHGMRPHSTEWHARRLDATWAEYKREWARDAAEFEMDGRTVWLFLQAVMTTGGRGKMWQVWSNEVRDRWR